MSIPPNNTPAPTTETPTVITQSTTSSENSQVVTPVAAPSSETPPVTPAPVVPPVAPVADEGYDLTLAEGSPLSEEDLNVIAEYASEHGLTEAQAKKLVEIKEGAFKKGETTYKNAEEAKILKSRAELKAAPEFSGEAATQSWESVGRAIETFGDDAVKELFNTPGIGDNLVLARFLKKIGDAMAPDAAPPAGSGVNIGEKGAAGQTVAQRMYPEYFSAEKK